VLNWQQVLLGSAVAEVAQVSAVVATIIRTALFGWEATNLRQSLADPQDVNHRPALTIWRLCRPLLFARGALFAGATLFGVLAITHGGMTAAIYATLSLVLTFASQMMERYFFFTAVVAPRMPGGIAA
jgi:DMSO reductase anchor subunit